MDERKRGDDGKPLDPSYLECALPEGLQKSIDELKNAPNESYRGLLQEELYGDINWFHSTGEISLECVRYLRKKYLGWTDTPLPF